MRSLVWLKMFVHENDAMNQVQTNSRVRFEVYVDLRDQAKEAIKRFHA